MTPGRLAISLLVVVVLNQGSRTLAAEEHHLPLRNHNPFLQVTGLPVFQGATLTVAGRTDLQLALDLANHADAGGGKGEAVTLDGETTILTLRGSLKLPTGDDAELTGSGGTDAALGLYATDTTLFSRDHLSGTAFAGTLLRGDSDLLPGIQNDVVGFAGLAAGWELDNRFALNAQFYGQTAYYDSAIDVAFHFSVRVLVE